MRLFFFYHTLESGNNAFNGRVKFTVKANKLNEKGDLLKNQLQDIYADGDSDNFVGSNQDPLVLTDDKPWLFTNCRITGSTKISGIGTYGMDEFKEGDIIIYGGVNNNELIYVDTVFVIDKGINYELLKTNHLGNGKRAVNIEAKDFFKKLGFSSLEEFKKHNYFNLNLHKFKDDKSIKNPDIKCPKLFQARMIDKFHVNSLNPFESNYDLFSFIPLSEYQNFNKLFSIIIEKDDKGERVIKETKYDTNFIDELRLSNGVISKIIKDSEKEIVYLSDNREECLAFINFIYNRAIITDGDEKGGIVVGNITRNI